jgi:hypothetical protein
MSYYEPAKSTMSQEYYHRLLEGRAKRLNELLEIAAPQEMICKEVILIVQAASLLNPHTFKSWSNNNGKEHATAAG